MKRFCAEHLPLYMIPDRFIWLDELPKTSTDKIDYQRLKELALMDFRFIRRAEDAARQHRQVCTRDAQRRRRRARSRPGFSRASSGASARELGLHGLPVPEEYGGSGARPAVLRDRARGAGLRLPRRRAGVFALRAPAGLRRAASGSTAATQQKPRYLPGLCDGTLVGRPRDHRARLRLGRVLRCARAPSATAAAGA